MLGLPGLARAVPARAQTSAAPTTSHPAAAALMNDPKRAEKDVEAGDKAAAEGRFDDALAAYDEAARYAPQNIAILGKGATLRSQLVRAHTDNAEQFALHGDVSKAIEELHTAMHIDPGNPALAERLGQIAAMHDDDPAPRPTRRFAACQSSTFRPGKHNLDLHGDTRSAYDMVTHMFGIKAAFDPDLPARRVHLRVDDVDFATAIVATGETIGTFWRPVDANLIFVAADTNEKRQAVRSAGQANVSSVGICRARRNDGALARAARNHSIDAHRARYQQPLDHDARHAREARTGQRADRPGRARTRRSHARDRTARSR